jgi:two-component system cell cycle response regulator DivK
VLYSDSRAKDYRVYEAVEFFLERNSIAVSITRLGDLCFWGRFSLNIQKHSLMVVESSATYLFYMSMMLKKLEYTVRTATTGKLALEAMHDPLPALIMVDTFLDDMSGVSLLEKMKEDKRLKTIPVIMHTADSDGAVRDKCMALGCVGYFQKPVDPDELYRTIQSATEATPRRTIRIETSLKVEVGAGQSGGGKVRTEVVTSLSDGGLYIKTMTPEAVNTVLPLKIFFANRQVSVKAEVHYSSTKIGEQHKYPGMGMQFVSISKEDKAFIKEFIREQIAKGFEKTKR